MSWHTTIHRTPCAEPPGTCEVPGCMHLAEWWCCAIENPPRPEPRLRTHSARCTTHARQIAVKTGADFPDDCLPREVPPHATT